MSPSVSSVRLAVGTTLSAHSEDTGHEHLFLERLLPGQRTQAVTDDAGHPELGLQGELFDG